MTSSSERTAGASAYARFIPREELDGFAAWRPHAFGDAPKAGSPAPSEADRAAAHEAALAAARQDGYQAGYRDGLAALESFKQSFAQQVAAQIGQLMAAFDAEFAALEGQIAEHVARTATELARQVVRHELTSHPQHVAQVAADAVQAVLLSARHLRVHVHPDDLPLVRSGAADALDGRAARLVGDATVSRGGCRVESDLGSVDASLEMRWAQAAAALGQDAPLPGHDAP
ncbi:MAG TPA: FliH/SctL family protein [Burkholderiaceae bacterium]|nr:FliH/SctL family protein [Burkholderiaceae bacterium]